VEWWNHGASGCELDGYLHDGTARTDSCKGTSARSVARHMEFHQLPDLVARS
jgi:hypothetical protein